MASSRLSWQVTPIMASRPIRLRASATEPSDCPRCTPSQPERAARSGRSLRMTATPRAWATGVSTATAARTAASSASLSRICRAATSPASNAVSRSRAKAARSGMAGGVIRYNRQGGRSETAGILDMGGKCDGCVAPSTRALRTTCIRRAPSAIANHSQPVGSALPCTSATATVFANVTSPPPSRRARHGRATSSPATSAPSSAPDASAKCAR